MTYYKELYEKAQAELDQWTKAHPFTSWQTSGSSGGMCVPYNEPLVTKSRNLYKWAELEKDNPIVEHPFA